MIDSGATGNFIIKQYARDKRHPIREKEQPYGLVNLNGTSLGKNKGWINQETIPLPVAFQKHHKELVFDVVDIASHNIILGVPWLRKHNPQVN